MKSSTASGSIIEFFKLLLLALVYATSAVFCLQFDIGFTNASPIWIPSGVALYGLSKIGKRGAVAVWLGAFVSNFYQFTHDGAANAPYAAALIGVGNAMEALYIAVVLEFNGYRLFEIAPKRPSRYLLIIMVAPVLGCLISAVNGATVVSHLVLGDVCRYFEIMKTWLVGDVLGVFAVTYVLQGLEQWLRAIQERVRKRFQS